MTLRMHLIAALEGSAEKLLFSLPSDFFPRGGYDFSVTARAAFPEGVESMVVKHDTHQKAEMHDCADHAYSSTLQVGKEGVFAIAVTPKRALEPLLVLEESENKGQKETEASTALALTFFPTWDHLDKDLFTPHVEVVFLVDRSGSMASGFGPKRGIRILKARETLTLFLSSLPENCRFQVIGFGTTFEELFPLAPEPEKKKGARKEVGKPGEKVARPHTVHEAAPYNADTLRAAQQHVAAMDADLGGTDLLAPLMHVLATPASEEYPRHVFVLTDGNIDNIESTISQVLKKRGSTIIHCVGIGSGADEKLVIGLAHAGKGESSIIADNGDMKAVVIKQLSRALEPTLRKVAVELVNCTAQHVSPAKHEPLVSGERLNVYALGVDASQPGAAVRISGIAPDESTFERLVPFDGVAKTRGRSVHLLAAHAAVRDLESLSDGALAAAGKTIEALGLKYELVTIKTSFGAIFENTQLPNGEMVSVNVSGMLEEGHAVYMQVPEWRNRGRRHNEEKRKKKGGVPSPRSGGPPLAPKVPQCVSLANDRRKGGTEMQAPRQQATERVSSVSVSSSRPSGVVEFDADDLDGFLSSDIDKERVGEIISREDGDSSGDDEEHEKKKEEGGMRFLSDAIAPPSASVSPSKSAAAPSAAPAPVAMSKSTNDPVMRAATSQDAVGFWTLEAASTLTGLKGVKDPTGASNSALFGTALVIEWLALKQAAQEAEWKLLAQKARTWLKKQQIALKLQSTDFLALAREILASK